MRNTGPNGVTIYDRAIIEGPLFYFGEFDLYPGVDWEVFWTERHMWLTVCICNKTTFCHYQFLPRYVRYGILLIPANAN